MPKKLVRSVVTQIQLKQSYAVAVLIVFAGIGASILIRTFAATPQIVAFEAEQAALSGGPVLASDATASGGQYIVFRPTATPTTPPPPPPTPTTGSFQIRGNTIYDPAGQPYLPRGNNTFAGLTFSGFTSDITTPDVMTRLIDWWKQNAFIVATCPSGHCTVHENGGGQTIQGPDIDAVVQAYTARKVVIILSDFDRYGGLDNLPADYMQITRTWYAQMATKYKNNPYVWFEPYNEGFGGPKQPSWSSGLYEPVIQAIRGTGNQNPIVLNAADYGQDRQSAGDAFNYSESTILSYGPALVQKYSNLMFDIHIYSRWANSSQQTFTNYFKAVHDAGLAIYVGQTSGAPAGAPCTWDLAAADFEATKRIYAAKPAGVGIFPWSTGACYPHVSNGLLQDVNSATNPTNLIYNGPLHWEWTHNPPSATP